MKWEKDPRKIAKKLEESRKLLNEVFMSIPKEEWFDKKFNSKWSVSDVLIHIIGWDELLLYQAKEWIKGRTPKGYNEIQEDIYNEEYIKSHPVNSKEEAITRFNNSTRGIIDFLNSLTSEERTYALEHESLVDLDLYSHDVEHYNALKEVMYN